MKPRITLRVNGTRVGNAARPGLKPSAEDATPDRLPTRRVLVPRANAQSLVRDYRDDDDNGVAS